MVLLMQAHPFFYFRNRPRRFVTNHKVAGHVVRERRWLGLWDDVGTYLDAKVEFTN